MTIRKTYRLLTVLGALCLAPAGAFAQNDSAAAQSLFDQAKELMASGRSADACPKLEESQRLDPRSGTLINLARCYEDTQRFASAWSRYLEAATAAKSAGNTDRETVARQRAAALAPRLSKLIINAAPTLKGLQGLEITRDGVLVGEPAWGVPLPSDGGEHVVMARAPGYRTFEARAIVGSSGQTISVDVPELTALPKPAAPPEGAADPTRPFEAPRHVVLQQSPGMGATKAVAIVVGGLGLAGIGVGTTFGLISKSQHDTVVARCPITTECDSDAARTRAKDAWNNGNVATVGFIAGGVALATAITLWIVAPSSSSSTQVGLGLGTIQAKGSF
ncbi:MAG TPA: hypothetical protein VEQ58_16065 [Polyangiaceae bacterium]|nr:hypothetical protein [Polyangiaceae bacterium]